MAVLVASQVSLYPTNGTAEWYPQGKSNKTVITRRLKIASLAQGGATNTIGAAALGLTTILQCGNLWDETNSKSYQAVVDPVNNVILLSAIAADTAADVTATVAYITVTGTFKSPVTA